MAGPFGFTVFYPATWDDTCLHPIGAWGNGTGVIGSWVYEHLNSARRELGRGGDRFGKPGGGHLGSGPPPRDSTGCSRRTQDPESPFYTGG